uniref:Uncharacterized protein n=1 Tax=Fagus sylvatica TaxID=28930 RepID=A0A2N9IW92_FAGSY
MASIRGIKNEKGVSKPEIQSQDEHEVVTDKPQSSRDAEIASLKREISALTEALEKQQWLNPVELDRVDPFGRSRAPNRDPYQFTDVDREPNRGFERSVLGQDRHHHREPLGFHREHHRGRVTNPWCARELQDQRLLNPNTFPLGYDWVKPPVETHDRPCFGPPKSSGVGQPRTHHAFKPFGHFDPGPDPSLDPHNHDTLYTDRELRHHHEPVGHDRDQRRPPIFDREPCWPPIFDRPQVLDLDGFDRAAPNQDHNNYNWNREPLVLDRAPRDLDHAPRDLDRAPPGFDRAPPAFNRFNRAPPPQQAHVFFAFHGVDSPVLNREHCTTDPRWDTSQCWDYVDEIEEIIIQPPVYDIEVEDESEGDQEVKDMTLILEEILPAPKDGMLIDEHVSSQFVNCYQQVPKEEIEERKRLENNISHSTCRSEDKVFELLIDEECCSLHKKEHHYTLRPKKDTTKSKPTVKMKIIGFPNVGQGSNLLLSIAFKGMSA